MGAENVLVHLPKHMYSHSLMVYSHIFIYMDGAYFHAPVHVVTHTNMHTPIPMKFSVHFLALALHDDFSRCLSPGHQQSQDWEGVPGGGLLSPSRKEEGLERWSPLV